MYVNIRHVCLIHVYTHIYIYIYFYIYVYTYVYKHQTRVSSRTALWPSVYIIHTNKQATKFIPLYIYV